MKYCKAAKKNGKPCQAVAVEGFDLCNFHEPSRAQVIQEGRLAGAREMQRKPEPPENLPPISLKTKEGVLDYAQDTADRVRSGKFSPKQGTAIGSILGLAWTVLKASTAEEEAQQERPLDTATLQRLEELARDFQSKH